MRAEIVREFDRPALLEEWRRLYSLSDARFFHSPPWIETWTASLSAAADLAVIRVFDDLRGLHALGLVSFARARSPAAPREAFLHETGDRALDRIYAEYNDLLVARTAPADAREEGIAALFDSLPRTDEFVFRNVRPALAAAIEAAAQKRRFEIRPLAAQPTFQVGLQDGASVSDGFSSSLRAKIRRAIRRYEQRGPVALERVDTEAGRSIAWTELMRLHAETWSRRGASGLFGEAKFGEFHRRLADNHPHSIDLVRLTVGGAAIGVLYNFIAGDRVYNYQSGFRYESDNQLVPGYVCHALAADRYRRDGFSLYDLMAGDAEYKRRLGKEGETLRSLVATRPGVGALVRKALRRVRDWSTLSERPKGAR